MNCFLNNKTILLNRNKDKLTLVINRNLLEKNQFKIQRNESKNYTMPTNRRPCGGTTCFKVARKGMLAFTELGECEVLGFVSCGGCREKKQ